MKKLFALMLIPLFLAPLKVISTEKTVELTNAQVYQLTSTVVTETTYFDSIPITPVLNSDSSIYEDENLTIVAKTLKADTKLSIVDLIINDNATPVFELSDGNYIEATHLLIYDDVVSSQVDVSEDYWLEAGFKIYDKPYVTGSREVSSSLSSYTEVHVSQKAVTAHGIYYKINGAGWVEESYLSEIDNRMEKVQQILTEKYNNSNYSVYVKQLSTDETAGINENTVMYSASVAKLATLYYVEEQIESGFVKASNNLTYTEEVNSFTAAYDPNGSGNISKTADNKDYSIETLLKAIAQNSDNVATNILGYYVANQYDDDFQYVIKEITGVNLDMKERNMSAKTAANLMEAIYYQDSDLISYLSSTDYDTTRISKDISVQVAHKVGDAYDYKHDVAIIYADEPFILSIFTNNASYDDISNIANDIYAILK